MVMDQMKSTTMKKIFSLGSILLAATLITCCTGKDCHEEQSWQTHIVSADHLAVKTALSGHEVIWQEEDQVSCFCFERVDNKYSLSSGISPKSVDGTNAVFEITNKSGFTPEILIYPSSNAYKLPTESTIALDVPSEMSVEKDNAPAQGMVSLGKITDGQVNMRNVMSLLKFTISSEDICRIEVKAPGGEPLSGDVVIAIESLQAVDGGLNQVAVVPSGDLTSFVPGTYYIPVPANEYTNGLKVRFEKTNGDAADKSYTDSYTVNRNRIISMGEEDEWDLEFTPSSFTKEITFITESGAVFPFSNEPEATTATTAPGVSSVAGKGEFGPFYLLGWPDMPFYFNVQNVDATKDYFTSQGTYGLRMGGSKGDYMALPAVAGYRLTSITIEEGSSSSYYAVTTHPVDGSAPQYLTNESVTINKNTSRTFEFDATKTIVGKAYRICTGQTNPTAIKKMSITYKRQ